MATITDTKARNIKPTDPAIPHGGITGLSLLPSSIVDADRKLSHFFG